MNASADAGPFVDIQGLTVSFTGGRRPVQAVGGVDLQVQRGEVVALIGESGSGKSVTLRSLLRLHPPRRTRIGGRLLVGGQDVLALSPAALADYRGRVASMIFQEPLLALDPVYTLGAQIIEAIRRHEAVSAAEAQARALALFERVRIPSPERRLQAYPHEMSGGMRQRAMIALALACRPQLLLADEPTTALDATVQIQILLLLRELQRDLGLSVIFVTHDIGAAIEVADRIAVMYAGRIVEEGPARTLIRAPRHPYTQALLKSRAHGALAKGSRLETIGGAPPDLSALPPGCAFAERCAHAAEACRQTQPAMVRLSSDHGARCLRTEATAPGAQTPSVAAT
ncbi:ABC transporter ATP-binding protein [Aquabacterium sp.]|uniref:ABC transporter ATP-binding protein n=1 Tax=Aquabacterium sp. TaxID=1872578 RepID=UPI002CFC6E9B|nr:ABC transporter ATP-binding protein [Aquabacterium sp.]HSW07645.1 ABC transporter ATP-binding protein [Aquabacterium sp.]